MRKFKRSVVLALILLCLALLVAPIKSVEAADYTPSIKVILKQPGSSSNGTSQILVPVVGASLTIEKVKLVVTEGLDKIDLTDKSSYKEVPNTGTVVSHTIVTDNDGVAYIEGEENIPRGVYKLTGLPGNGEPIYFSMPFLQKGEVKDDLVIEPKSDLVEVPDKPDEDKQPPVEEPDEPDKDKTPGTIIQTSGSVKKLPLLVIASSLIGAVVLLIVALKLIARKRDEEGVVDNEKVRLSKIIMTLAMLFSLLVNFLCIGGQAVKAAGTLPVFDNDLYDKTTTSGSSTIFDYKVADYGAAAQFYAPNVGDNSKLLGADGYSYGTRLKSVAFPGAKGTFSVNLYTFWGSYTWDKKGTQDTAVAPLTAFYLVLPKAVTTTQADIDSALVNYVQSLKTAFSTQIDTSTFTSLTADLQSSFDGRQVWLITPNTGAKFKKRAKYPVPDTAFILNPNTTNVHLNIRVQINANAVDLNGSKQSTISLQPPAGSSHDTTSFNTNVVYNVVPFQYYNNKDFSFMADAMATNQSPLNPLYGTMTSGTAPVIPTFARPTLGQYNASHTIGMTLMSYWDGANNYTYDMFDPIVIDTFAVKDSAENDVKDQSGKTLTVTMKYVLKLGSDGKYVGSYVLDTTNTDIQAIRNAGYQITNIAVTSQKKAPLATAAGTTADWSSVNTNVWKRTTTDFSSANVTYNYPIDTTVQWNTLPAKAAELASRPGVITVQKVNLAPLTINVVDYKNTPLPNVNVTIKDSKGNPVTKDYYGNPLVLKTDANGKIVAPNLPYDTYTVTQTDTVTGLIKPGPGIGTISSIGDATVTLINKRELVPDNLPLTGSNDSIFLMLELLAGGLFLFWEFTFLQKKLGKLRKK